MTAGEIQTSFYPNRVSRRRTTDGNLSPDSPTAPTTIFDRRPTLNPSELTALQCYFPLSDRAFYQYYVLCVLSLGILPLYVRHWDKSPYLALTHRTCSFREARVVLVRGAEGETELLPVTYIALDAQTTLKYYTYRKQRYVYNETLSCYRKLNSIMEYKTLDTILSDPACLTKGQDETSTRQQQLTHGPNSIDVDAVPVTTMVFDKVTQPFYLFQLFSFSIWCYEKYYTYSAIILLMSICSVYADIELMKSNEKKLRSLTKMAEKVCVLRNGKRSNISSEELTLGDLVILDNLDDLGSGGSSAEQGPKRIIPCDLLLLSGSVLIDESSLTGESVPIAKVAYDALESKMNSAISPSTSPVSSSQVDLASSMIWEKKNLLLSGSRVLEVQIEKGGSCVAIVTATGYSTTKGQMFRTILFPKSPINNADSYYFLLMLVFFGLIAVVDRFIHQIQQGRSVGEALLISLDLLTIAVPPALPLILTIGIQYSIGRLEKARIFCIQSGVLHHAGKLDVVCWDKTGTLTKDCLELQHVVSFESGNIEPKVTDGGKPHSDMPLIERCMATCHDIQILDGKRVGHTLDLEMFDQTEWRMDTSQGNHLPDLVSPSPSDAQFAPIRLSVLKRFEFDSLLQCATVIAKDKTTGSISAFTKGAPEAIFSKCDSVTITKVIRSTFKIYAENGAYVLACAVRPLSVTTSEESEIQSTTRNQVEQSMVFLGFLVFHNPLHPDALGAIRTLQCAQIRNVMITGDNDLSARFVSKVLGLCFKETVTLDVAAGALKRPDTGPFEILCTPSGMTRNTTVSIKKTTSMYGRGIEEGGGGGATRDEPFPLDYLVSHLSHHPQVEVCVSGPALEQLIQNPDKEFVNWIIGRTRIFSSCKPMQKTWVVETLMAQGWKVAMCGDGSNDCGALRAAHVGLALSAAEASMVAPFTSGSKTAADMPLLIREGRCAIEVAYSSFKYMVLYSTIQLLISASLYHLGTALGNNSYLFDDLFLVISLSILMQRPKPTQVLEETKPKDSLFNAPFLVSIFGQMVICLIFFGSCIAYLNTQTWYCPADQLKNYYDSNWNLKAANASMPLNCYKVNPSTDVVDETVLINSQETTIIWNFMHFQFLGVAIAFSIVATYKESMLSNRPFVLWALFLFVLMTGMMIGQVGNPAYVFLSRLFGLRADIPTMPRFYLWLIVLLNMVVSVGWEIWAVEWVSGWVQVKSEQRAERVIFDTERRVGVHEELNRHAAKAAFTDLVQGGTGTGLGVSDRSIVSMSLVK